MLFLCTHKEAFPFIRQIISDAYMTDAWYLSAPYTDLDKADRGFRSLLLQKEDIASLLAKSKYDQGASAVYYLQRPGILQHYCPASL